MSGAGMTKHTDGTTRSSPRLVSTYNAETSTNKIYGRVDNSMVQCGMM
jgi:hypothetical protein